MALHCWTGSLGSQSLLGIRQRDALPSPVHETEMPEICLPLRKRPCRTTPGPGYEVGESSAAGAARQVGPTTARADLYGFADMIDAAPGRQTSRELGYGITDTWDDLVVAIQRLHRPPFRGGQSEVIGWLLLDRPFHRRTAFLMEEEARLSSAALGTVDGCLRSDTQQTVGDRDGDFDLLESRHRRTETVSGGDTKDSKEALKTQMIELQRPDQGPAGSNRARSLSRGGQTVTNEVAYAMTWTDLKKKMTTKYCNHGGNEIRVEAGNCGTKSKRHRLLWLALQPTFPGKELALLCLIGSFPEETNKL
ncbi:hypothetical protein Tco_1184395 [Tanacetum coccineum]